MSFDVHVGRHLGATRIEVSFTAPAGLTALFGPSGAGKTSVLNMVAGLLRPDTGRIVVGGEVLFDSAAGIDMPAQDRRAGYVFQDGRLFPHLRVRDNLAYGAPRADGAGLMTLDEAADFLGIAHLLGRWPRTLSGGEAQRVAIGRALLSGPRFLLMDEPLAALDRARREEVLRVIERLRDEVGLPILYVSHDRAEVERLAGCIAEI
ncbi:ATP-binding cassette domain-containing protein [Novosphingobium sp. MMS21-SN21R]|uniref:molybdenum ABC transporter ATP-binding protein n=1 Tax=Novosphingobium sp. MMS21-SN21R TaxID=2969298 RepID=UPI002888DBC9|nr:ATP-binding cassette domain-containing protein [Novosphingobium sp. MMS21-SN21R]MDT0506406.1 ATP-binding cassette domain-containing protein [Novosphingobium sp. MMS21-SN21R]